MKYLTTPMSIVALLLLILAIYGIFTTPKNGDGLQYFWIYPMIGVALIMLLISFSMTTFMNNYKWLFLIQTGMLIAFAIFLYFAFRQPKINIIILPDNFDKPFVAMIFDVENAAKLFEDESQVAPENGILYNAENHKNAMPAIQIEGHFPNGEKVNGFFSFGGTLQCSEKNYAYQIWYIKEYDNGVADIFDIIKTEVNAILKEQCKFLKNGVN